MCLWYILIYLRKIYWFYQWGNLEIEHQNISDVRCRAKGDKLASLLGDIKEGLAQLKFGCNLIYSNKQTLPLKHQ